MNRNHIASLIAGATLLPLSAVFASGSGGSAIHNEGNYPSSQNASYRNANRISDRTTDSHNTAASAGGSYGDPKAPIDKEVMESGCVHTPYFEYSYMNIDEDIDGSVLDGHQHNYAIGYDIACDSGLLIGIMYEYGDRFLEDEAFLNTDQSFDTHTVAAYASYAIFGNVYANLSGGYTSGSFNTVPGALLGAFNGNAYFVNPGVSSSWTFGNLIVNAGVSYLYTDSDYTQAPIAANDAAWGQLIPELGARYNVSDSVYVGSKIQYNAILDDEDFVPNTVDVQWWRASAEVGVLLASGVEVNVGVDYDFADQVYDNVTGRVGLLFTY